MGKFTHFIPGKKWVKICKRVGFCQRKNPVSRSYLPEEAVSSFYMISTTWSGPIVCHFFRRQIGPELVGYSPVRP
jgi:hypothetical protein